MNKNPGFVERAASTGMPDDGREYRKFIMPITLGIEPMERLLIADFVDDPEFESLEPQVFDDEINGKGMRILRYRRDKKVDVYREAGVHVDPETFNIGAGIGDFEETVIEPAVFEIDESRVNLHVAFTDRQGRKIELSVRETADVNRRLSFLAPVGNDIENPKQFFLAYMLDFDFIRKKGTEASASIDGRRLIPASFPLLRNYKRVLFIRYSARPSVGVLNPPMDIPTEFYSTVPGSAIHNGNTITVSSLGTIASIKREYRNVSYEIDFPDGFPDLPALDRNERKTGVWTFRIAGDMISSGTYDVVRHADTVTMEIDVTGRWKPSGLPLSLNLFTRVVSFFRTWPTTYRWRGSIEVGSEISMKGSWERKNRKL